MLCTKIPQVMSFSVGLSVLATLCAAHPARKTHPAHSPKAKASVRQTDSSHWQPNPALLKQLAPEVSLGDYWIHPPQGYEMQPETQEGERDNLSNFSWETAERTDKTQPDVTVTIISPRPGFHPINDENILDKFQKPISDKLESYTASPSEQGSVHGIPFVRVYWKGVDPKSSQHVHGFTYIAVDSFTIITIIGSDEEPYSQSNLPLLEAAAETFRPE